MSVVALSATPLDLMASDTMDSEGGALGLDATAIYSFQAEIPAARPADSNSSNGPFVHVSDADEAPTNLNGGRKVRSMETIRIQAGTGGSFWAWCHTAPAQCNVFVDV